MRPLRTSETDTTSILTSHELIRTTSTETKKKRGGENVIVGEIRNFVITHSHCGAHKNELRPFHYTKHISVSVLKAGNTRVNS